MIENWKPPQWSVSNFSILPENRF